MPAPHRVATGWLPTTPTKKDGMMSKGNGVVSSASEFHAAAIADREKRAVNVPLPSGCVARLVRPEPYESLLFLGIVPQSLAAGVLGAESGTRDVEEIKQRGAAERSYLRLIFMSPRVPDEAQPGVDISIEDVRYAVRWAGGEVTDSGQDLVPFPQGEAGPSASVERRSEALPVAAKPLAGA
jgi:hypothetical protein